jgi:hypothetical protein
MLWNFEWIYGYEAHHGARRNMISENLIFEHEWKATLAPRFLGNANYTFFTLSLFTLCLGPLVLVALCLCNVESQAIRVKVHLIARVL